MHTCPAIPIEFMQGKEGDGLACLVLRTDNGVGVLCRTGRDDSEPPTHASTGISPIFYKDMWPSLFAF